MRLRFNELTDAVQLLEKLTIKYVALIKAEVYSTLLPTFQYDWKEIFRFAWIEPARNDDIDGEETNEKIRLGTSFPPDLYETLEEIAKQKKVSLAWVVRDAAERYVAEGSAEAPRSRAGKG